VWRKRVSFGLSMNLYHGARAPTLAPAQFVWLGWLECGAGALSLGLWLLAALPAVARVGGPPPSFGRPVQPLATIQQLVLPPTYGQAELEADREAGLQTPLRFAVAHAIVATPATDGTWERLGDGRLWRLRVRSAGASDLNLGFRRFWLPEGATLHVISENGAYFQGPYTARDNKPHGQLWTPLIPGDAAVIELFVPTQAKAEPQLVLSQVGAGYRNLFGPPNPAPSPLGEGTCNIDVVCPIASPWTNEIRSVGLYTIGGTFMCSGTLIADVAGDLRNYFLTANHCGVTPDNAPTMVVYWNYQSTNCGTHGPGSLDQNQSGAVFRAGKFDVDFTLVELDEMPIAGFGVYYSGWDRSGTAPTGGVGIHHPECDVKAISFSSNALTTVNNCIAPVGTNTHWQVIWSLGDTEPGSSGSGFWDTATHRLVGTLSGGGASCGNLTGPDCYGKFAVAWASGDSPAERLADWLDPQDTGTNSVPGVDTTTQTLLIPAGSSLLSESFQPTNGAIDPGETVSVSFTIENFGGVPATNLVANLLPEGGVVAPGPAQFYGAVPSGASATQAFSFTASGYCGGTLAATLRLQDGNRFLGTATFPITLGAPVQVSLLSENFDEVQAPSLPSGWSASLSGGGSPWATSTNEADTPPNSVFATDNPYVSDNLLVCPSVFIHSTNAQVTFHHDYNVEGGYDGGVLEISLNSGPFNDIVLAGGGFASNGYNNSISPYYGNPLAGRNAWSGDSGGFITTTAILPTNAVNQYVQLRWRLGTDESYGIVGWYVDTISISEPGYVCVGSLTPPWIYNLRTVEPAALAFSYDSLAAQTYFVESMTNLGSFSWTNLQTNSGNNSVLSFTNSSHAGGQRYFRVRTQ
jgi:hypothetical protein